MKGGLLVTLTALALAACAGKIETGARQSDPSPSAPAPSAPGAARLPDAPPEAGTNPPPATDSLTLAPPRIVSLQPVRFQDLPGWDQGATAPGLAAFLASCSVWSARAPEAPLGRWGGLVADWLEACARLDAAPDSAARRDALMSAFVPMQVISNGATARLTGYYEPEIEARRAPEPGFEAAIPGLSPDMVRIDFGRFRPDSATERHWGKVSGRDVLPLPARASLGETDWQALGYADPIEVFFLQVQGSGRLRFQDGEVVRAVFAAHNGYPFVSLARHLIDSGEIDRANAGMDGLKRWLREVGPDRARAALNVNPRFVWFGLEPLADPLVGPRGSLGVPLTAFGSMAVDRQHHPLGVPFWLDTRLPLGSGLLGWQGIPWQGLVVAQDTGGAILGPLRGDLFFGTGADAGRRAGQMQHDMQMFALVPLSLAEQPAWRALWLAEP